MLSDDADRLKEELREFFCEHCSKGELMQMLAERLINFQQLKGTAFQVAINEFIVRSAEDGCEVVVHDEDIKMIWG